MKSARSAFKPVVPRNVLMQYDTQAEAEEAYSRQANAASVINALIEDIITRPLDAEHQRIVDEAPGSLSPYGILYRWYMDAYEGMEPRELRSRFHVGPRLTIPPYSKQRMRRVFLHHEKPVDALQVLMKLVDKQQEEINALKIQIANK